MLQLFPIKLHWIHFVSLYLMHSSFESQNLYAGNHNSILVKHFTPAPHHKQTWVTHVIWILNEPKIEKGYRVTVILIGKVKVMPNFTYFIII